MMDVFRNILHLGIKELRGVMRDPILVVLIVFSFTLSIYTAASAMPEALNKAAIAIVDEDNSPVSRQIADAFYPPFFVPPKLIGQAEMDARMDAGLETFALVIPAGFQEDLLAGHRPALQLNVDATRMSQAFTGSGYVQNIVYAEISEYLQRHRGGTPAPVELALRNRFNPALDGSWFGSIHELLSSITMLSIILTGAALIREREHGTIEHLLVMPVTPFEIMTAKVWSMGLIVLAASAFALVVVVHWMLSVPMLGSLPLFFVGVALQLFATTSMGIFLATVAGSMPQFGMLLMLVLLPLQLLSGTMTPRESMPEIIQTIMLAAPNTHFGIMAQAILFRGAGLEVVWPQILALIAIGSVLFLFALQRFRAFLK